MPGSFSRLGRQDIKLGQEVLYPEPNWRHLELARLGERLVGTVGWSHVERAYDGGAGAFDAESAYSSLRDVTLGTFGGHWLGVHPLGPGSVDVLLWGVGQFGEVNGLDHAAGAGIAEVGCQLTDVFAKPWLRLGVKVATGAFVEAAFGFVGSSSAGHHPVGTELKT